MSSRTALAVALLFTFAAASTAALADVAVENLDGVMIREIGPAATAGTTCTTGNPSAPSWTISGILQAPQEYEILFDPFQGCDACIDVGYRVSMIHVVLRTSAACDIAMDVGLAQSHEGVGAACPLLGGELCAAGLYSVAIPYAGMWDIGIPIECNCTTVDASYLLSVYFESISCVDGSLPKLVTEYYPSSCENWLYDGEGWVDLLAQYPWWPGDLSVWADAICCSSTASGQQSWSALKGRFRD